MASIVRIASSSRPTERPWLRVMATVGAEIRLWQVGDGTLLRQFKSRRNTSVSHMAFSPDGKVLAAIGGQGSPVFFDTATGKELDSFGKELSSEKAFGLLADSADRPLAFSPDGRTLAATGNGRPFTSGTWRRARTDWRLPKPTWVT